ncbi:ribonuclease H-like domain-containing protein, partial [Mycena olivaceomarginata]
LGFDMEWEFTTGIGATGPQKTALIQIAVKDVVYLLYVYTLKKLPSSLEALLRSKNFLKVGRQIESDFQKLARDFPGLKLPKKRKKGFIGTLDIGRLAAKKNVVPQATASLQAIVAAALGAYLSKEHRVSSWSTPNYSDLEKDYAALDAHVLLMLVENLQLSRADGQPLSSL